MLSFAFSPCPNDTFAFDAWVHNKIPSSIQVTPHLYDIEELNRLALEGCYDITKVSAFALALLDHEYVLMKSGAALGHGMGPKVVAKEPFNLVGKKVAIPGRLTTAAFLFREFYPGNTLIEMPYHTIVKAVESHEVDAGVIIHETRFTHNLYEIADLGTLYQDKFCTPIPLGVIVARRSLGEKRLQEIEQTLFDSIVYAKRHPESSLTYTLKAAQEKNPEVVQKHICLYVNQETERLTPEGLYAIEKMRTLCHTQ